MKTLNVIGCGNVGSTLACLWHCQGILQIQSILNRSLQSSQQAVKFVGAGHAAADYAQLQKADLWMISTSDASIEQCCQQLCRTELLDQGTIVFHCSGALPSTLLEPARQQGASIASIHPVKSFADPTIAVETFAGTFCALEGDAEACATLRDVFERCGAITFPIRPEHKSIHHVATVLASNYLVALIETALRCFERARLPREDAIKVIEPIVTGVVGNVFRLGPASALTGPIARGEQSIIEDHCKALAQWDKELLAVYRSLGRVAADLSATQGNAPPEALAAIRDLLDKT